MQAQMVPHPANVCAISRAVEEIVARLFLAKATRPGPPGPTTPYVHAGAYKGIGSREHPMCCWDRCVSLLTASVDWRQGQYQWQSFLYIAFPVLRKPGSPPILCKAWKESYR